MGKQKVEKCGPP